MASIFDPFGNAVHTALAFPVLGEDVLITGAGPIGIMAAAVVRHAGARHVVITDVNEYRLELARADGRHPGGQRRARARIADVQAELGMDEGFDVGLEMSGNAAALRDMIANMAHGGQIAMLGIPPEEFAIDWNQVVFNMLTIKGIYGREMYETWYAMSVMVQAGLDISPVITHHFGRDEYEEAFATAAGGARRQGHPALEGLGMYSAVKDQLAVRARRDPRRRPLQGRARDRHAAERQRQGRRRARS